MNLQTFSDFTKKIGIHFPEYFWKEEIVRYISEIHGERMVEIPLVFSRIPNEKKKILDVGCRYSLQVMQLASIGHEVYGIDVKPYIRKHPNLKFVQGDFLHSPFKSSFFDIVISLSSIEHFGLGAYGDPQELDGDLHAVKEAKRVLKNNGTFLLTIPFGKSRRESWYRVYNNDQLHSLLNGFHIKEILTYRKKKGVWFPSSIREAERSDQNGELYTAIAFVHAIKKTK